MKILRRQFLHGAVGVIAVPALARLASAQTYPSRPVRLIVGSVAGSSPDVSARLIAQWLSERLGQPVVVENHTGGSDNLAVEAVVRAPADGYTLLLASASNAINATLFDHLNFNFIRDVAPVAGIVRFPNVVTVNASFPARSLPDFIAYAKANPGKINVGTPGIGSPQHIAGELFKMMAGVNIVIVAYRGGPPAVDDAISGQIEGVIGTVLLVLNQVRSGALRGLAVTAAKRSRLLPDVPTVSEFVPGFEATQWIGIGAPKDTSAAIIEKLNHEINAGLADPVISARIANLGGTSIIDSPAEFANLIAADTEKWGKVVRFAKLKAE